MLRMMTQQQIISVIHQVAGCPLSVLDRTARNLTKAGLLQNQAANGCRRMRRCFSSRSPRLAHLVRRSTQRRPTDQQFCRVRAP
jgi:hypothetical protein